MQPARDIAQRFPHITANDIVVMAGVIEQPGRIVDETELAGGEEWRSGFLYAETAKRRPK